MSCNLGSLYTIDGRCDQSMGGIKAIYLIKRDDITAKPTVDENTEEITALTVATDKKFVKWSFRKGTGSYTSTFASDEAIGNQSITTVVTLQFSRAEATKRMKIQSALATNAVVVVEDMYGHLLYLGYENDVTATNGTMVSGTATTDLSGFTLELTDVATTLPYFLAETLTEDFEANYVAEVNPPTA